MNDKKAKTYRILILLLMAVTVILTGILFAQSIFSHKSSRNTQLHTDVISFAPGQYAINHSAEDAPKLDTDYPYEDLPPIEIYLTLPEESDDSSYIMLNHSQSWVRAWLDDEPVYSFFPSSDGTGPREPASIYHIFRLPENWEGKQLHIEIVPSISEVAKIYPTIYLGDKGSLMLAALESSLLKAVACVVLFSVALIMMFISLAGSLKVYGAVIKRLRYFSLLLIDISIWVFMESRIRQFIFDNYTLSIDITIVCFTLSPILFASFLSTYQDFAQRRSFRILSILSWLQFIAYTIIAIAGKNPYSLQRITRLVIALIMIDIIYIMIRNRTVVRKMSPLYRSIAWMPAFVFAELIRYIAVSRMQSGIFIVLGIIFFGVQYAFLQIKSLLDEHIASVREKEQLARELTQERTRGMLAQMNPHFLYNALTSIQTLVKLEPDYAYDLIGDFTVHLRGTIKSLSVERISFKDEIRNVKAYLNIEQMRFGDRLRVDYDIRCDSFDIVPLSVQPLVENAARHGIFPKGSSGGIIHIISDEKPEFYIVQVADDGIGFDVDKVLNAEQTGDHIGIPNLIFRLRETMNADVIFESIEGKGTTVTIRIPKHTNEDPSD